MGSTMNCNYRISVTVYAMETWFVSGTVYNCKHPA